MYIHISCKKNCQLDYQNQRASHGDKKWLSDRKSLSLFQSYSDWLRKVSLRPQASSMECYIVPHSYVHLHKLIYRYMCTDMYIYMYLYLNARVHFYWIAKGAGDKKKYSHLGYFRLLQLRNTWSCISGGWFCSLLFYVQPPWAHTVHPKYPRIKTFHTLICLCSPSPYVILVIHSKVENVV